MNKNIKQDYQKKIDELKKHNKLYYENSSPAINIFDNGIGFTNSTKKELIKPLRKNLVKKLRI